jgi:hypothetical protein
MKGLPAPQLLEEYAFATRDLAQAVASEDWEAALEALERREKVLPELGRAFGGAQASSLVLRLEEILRTDEHSRAGLLEARSRITGRLREMDRIAQWGRSARFAEDMNGARLADLEG